VGTIITKKYSHLAEKKGLDRAFHIALSFFPLLIDVAKSGKLREISSFAIWEIRHKMGLFSQNTYITFEEHAPFILKEGDEISSYDFTAATKEDVFDITLTRNWKLFHKDSKNSIFGCLANENTVLYKSNDNGKTLKKLHTFKWVIKAIFISQEDVIFVDTKGEIYRSDDGGESFELSLELSEEDSSIFHHYGMTQIPSGALLVGEYGNVAKEGLWANIAYIYCSSDLGKTWERSDFLKKQGVNKHVHMIKYSHLLDRLILADGDNKKQLWISKPLENFKFSQNPWNLITKFHIQMGGYTSMVETDSKMILGTDYLGGTNFLVETTDGKNFSKKVIPDPYRRSPVHDLIKRGNEIWSVLNNPNSKDAKCLLMVSKNGGESWKKVIEYDGTKHLIMINSGDLKPTQSITFAITTMVEGGGERGVCYEIRDKSLSD